MELLRPNLSDNETLTHDEKLEALQQYMAGLAILGARVNEEYQWAQRTRIATRAEQQGLDPARLGLRNYEA
jgi:hypothetical protein